MEKHLFLINSVEKYTDFQEKRNFCEDTLVKPIVGYMPDETVVMYDANILPVNKELWEKFNLIFENHITCEDEWIFSTHPIEYKIEIEYNDDEQKTMNTLILYTADLEPCFGNIQNPDFKEVSVFTDDDSDNVEIDDFIGLGGEHTWENMEVCGK